MIENLTLIFTVLFVHFLAVVSPGPDFVVAVRNSLNFGRRVGVFTALGFGLGISVHLIYCYFGIAILISQSVQLFAFIKILGAMYLLYLAYQIFVHRSSLLNIEDLKNKDGKINSEKIETKVKVKKDKSEENMSDLNAFKSGFLTNVLNPKATLFFLGLFSTVIPANVETETFLVISFFLCFNTFLWFAFVAFIFTKEKSRNIFIKNSNYINILLSAVLVLLSVKILFF
jgi:threonine/homoserine/homoserine lactone efflux protein